VIAIFIQQAQADPAAGTIPGPSAIVGVGGEPSQGLFDQLAADYGHRRAPLYSWDETGASPIAPKQGCTPIERPAGSSSGITALIGRQVLPGGRPCIDFARSERGRQPQDPAGLVFLPYARDGVSWAANSVTNAPASLTPAQLGAIYECKATRWDQVGGTSPATIQPVTPLPGVGILGFLKAVFGVTQLGACVNQSVPDDNGIDPHIAGNPNALAIYDIGRYLDQAVYHHDDVHGTLQLHQISGYLPVVHNPADRRLEVNIGQVAGIPALPPALQINQWVVIERNPDRTLPASLRHLFAGGHSFLCSNHQAQEDVRDHGFIPLPGAACGVPH
jgi:PBP superfamily domain